jgi:hypothetical protein
MNFRSKEDTMACEEKMRHCFENGDPIGIYELFIYTYRKKTGQEISESVKNEVKKAILAGFKINADPKSNTNVLFNVSILYSALIGR